MKKTYVKAAEALDEKLAKYLQNEGIISLESIASEKQLEKLFFAFTRDFLKYQIFFDEFSTLCEKLLVVLRDIQDSDNSDLYMIFHYGAELSWYIRNEPVRAAQFLETILEYFRTNQLSSCTENQ